MQAHDLRTTSGNVVRLSSGSPHGYHVTRFDQGSDASRYVSAAVEASGLNYPVASRPIFVEDQDAIGGIAQIPDHQAIYRPDTGRVFGVQKMDYTIVPNDRGMDWIQPWLDSGEVRLIEGGHTDHGARIFLTAELDRARADVGLNDTVRLLLTFTNQHDGEGKARAALWAQRLSCLNGCTRMIALTAVSARHSKNVLVKLDQARVQFEQAREGLETLASTGRALRRRRLSDRNLRRLIRETLSEGAGNDESIVVRNVERIAELAETAPGADPGTLWGGLNALTYWATHERGRNDNSRANATMFGAGAALIDRAFEVAVQYADKLPEIEQGRAASENFATAAADFGALLGRPARIASEVDG